MIKLHIIVATGLALALAACSQEEAATPESPPAAEPVPATTEAAPATTDEPAPATAPADVQSTSGSGVTATNSDGTDLQASSAYDQGCAAGAEDANMNMSMAHERHSGEYDSQYEDTFRAGYEKCWTENRQ
jgi:hypothetical protein